MHKIELQDGERIDQLFSTDVQIIQNREVFSYSVDSVLLSRFPKMPAKKGLIVDLCSGNGAVGLFASTRTKAQIVQVELQERLADMNRRSIELNGLEEQLTVINDDSGSMPIDVASMDFPSCPQQNHQFDESDLSLLHWSSPIPTLDTDDGHFVGMPVVGFGTMVR